MLSYIKLKNFKSYKDITLDLRGSNGVPKKIAFIYGENGSGKSNLMYSVLFLSQTLHTLRNQERLKGLEEPGAAEVLESIQNEETKKEVFRNLMRAQFPTLAELIEEYKTIDCTDNMEIEVGFCLDGKRGIYSLVFDQHEIIEEKLRYQIQERIGTLFEINKEKALLSPSVFFDSEYRSELTEEIEKYWGKHTFVSLLFYEQQTKNSKYISGRVKKSILEVLGWLDTFSVLCKHNKGETGKMSIPYKFLRQLNRGIVKDKENRELKAFEGVLNTFFTHLYSDVKQAFYHFEPLEKGYKYELTLKKQVEGRLLDIPFSIESTGTENLLHLFPFLFSAVAGKTVLVDELDSGIHDLLICQIIEFLKDSLHGQFIATTHNTLLMRQLPNDAVYIIRTDAEGRKDIACISDYSFRTQRTNNIQSKYLDGAYEGVPYVGYLDFEELVSDVIDQMSHQKD